MWSIFMARRLASTPERRYSREESRGRSVPGLIPPFVAMTIPSRFRSSSERRAFASTSSDSPKP